MIPTTPEHLSLLQDTETLQKSVQVEHYPPKRDKEEKALKQSFEGG